MRGGRMLFRDVSFDVRSGGALLLRGPNGSGKSTLLRILAGLLQPETGTLDWSAGDADVETLRHYYGHADGLQPNMTVDENLGFYASLFGSPAENADEALEAVGLLHCGPLQAGFLSAGQKRRVAFARLLSVKRPVWLLDEPTSALDAASSEKMTGFMAEHIRAGGILVAATHLDLELPNAKVFGLQQAFSSGGPS